MNNRTAEQHRAHMRNYNLRVARANDKELIAFLFPNANIVDDVKIEKCIGKKVGSSNRIVYEHCEDPTCVIKKDIISETTLHQNIMEYATYMDARSKALWGYHPNVLLSPLNFLCPVVSLSVSGTYLVMRKAKVSKSTRYQVPKLHRLMFNDTKANNFGVFAGKLVCIDYGTLSMFHTYNSMVDAINNREETN